MPDELLRASVFFLQNVFDVLVAPVCATSQHYPVGKTKTLVRAIVDAHGADRVPEYLVCV